MYPGIALVVLPLAASAGSDTPAVELDAVMVTATASERPVARAPASVTVITGQQLRERPARDVLDAIRDAPGMNLRGGRSRTASVHACAGLPLSAIAWP